MTRFLTLRGLVLVTALAVGGGIFYVWFIAGAR